MLPLLIIFSKNTQRKIAIYIQHFIKMNNNKDKYKKLCDIRSDIPLFIQAWWMDAVCTPENKKWDVILIEKNNQIIAALPYLYIIKLGVKMALQPINTQFNGPWIDYPANQTTKQRLSFEKVVMNQIIEKLKEAKIQVFQQCFQYKITNWQPFYWKGFNQTTRYTYQLKDISNTQNVFNNFHESKQKHIRKAQANLQLDLELNAKEFYDFHDYTLKLTNNKIHYSESVFISSFETAKLRNQVQIFAIRDTDNNLHAAACILWDKQSAYYIISAIDPNFKTSGASTLMIWEAIKYLSDKTIVFDFGGSMIENVAKSFENFGAEQIPYFEISKYNFLFSAYLFFKNRIEKSRIS